MRKLLNQQSPMSSNCYSKRMHASGPASLSAKFFWNSVSERTLQTRFAAPQSQRWKCKRKGGHLNEFVRTSRHTRNVDPLQPKVSRRRTLGDARKSWRHLGFRSAQRASPDQGSRQAVRELCQVVCGFRLAPKVLGRTQESMPNRGRNVHKGPRDKTLAAARRC